MPNDMQALANAIGATTERFASSLNFNVGFDSYHSMRADDRLLGAIHDAYS